MKDLGIINSKILTAQVYSLVRKGESFKFVDKKSSKRYRVDITVEEPEIIEKEDGSKWQRIG